jgi:hypothetical protein
MSNGIDFVIGGKDHASPAISSAEKSLQRLQQKTSGVSKATKDLSEVNAGAASASKAASAAIAGMSKAAISATVAIAAIGAAAIATLFAVVKLHKTSAPLYDAQMEALRKLDSALRLRGASAGSSAMAGMAKNLEKLTGVSDNVTLALMHQAAGMGFATGAIDDAAKAAIGLSHAMGTDAASAMADLKSALEGNFDAFHAMNPQIQYMWSNQQKLAAVIAIANQGLSDQANDTQTVAGSARRANSAWQSLMETIGKILAPIRVLISAGIQQLAKSLMELLAPAVEKATKLLENIGPMMDWVKRKVVDGINAIIKAFTFVEVIVLNISDVFQLFAMSAELSMLEMVGTFQHAFTEVIPAYAIWFGENFTAIMRDAMNMAQAIVENMVTNISDAFIALWDFIVSGGQTDIMGQLGEIAGRSWLDGFESTLGELPDVMERQITDRERELAKLMEGIRNRMGDEFADKVKARMLTVGDDLAGLADAANINLKGRNSVLTSSIQATEGRLLTRGPASTVQQTLNEIAKNTRDTTKATFETGRVVRDSNNFLNNIDQNTGNQPAEIQLVPVS